MIRAPAPAPRRVAPALLLLAPLAGADGAVCAGLADLEWMLGEWQQASAGTVTRESWTRVSPDTFEGFGETLIAASGERRSAEALRLVRMQDDVFYLAKTSGNAMPVAFTLTGCGPGSATFENPAHDFPRRLHYEREGDGLSVAVSDGGERGFEIRFERHAPGGDEDDE